MLELLNRYAHGYLAVPVILALRRGGLFNRLNESCPSFQELAEELRANAGHLRVALRLLEFLGWIRVGEQLRIVGLPGSADHSLVPSDLGVLYEVPINAAWFRNLGADVLASLVARSDE